jgi:hypothetical protein
MDFLRINFIASPKIPRAKAVPALGKPPAEMGEGRPERKTDFDYIHNDFKPK